jgi:hypothetical protein
LRGEPDDPVEELRNRLDQLEARMRLMEAGPGLLKIKTEPEPEPSLQPRPVLVWEESVAGPSGSGGDVEMGPPEGGQPVVEQPEGSGPAEERVEVEVAVPVVVPEENTAPEEVTTTTEEVAEPEGVATATEEAAPEEVAAPIVAPEAAPAAAPVVKPEPEEPRILEPVRIHVRRVQGSIEGKEVEIIELLSDDE